MKANHYACKQAANFSGLVPGTWTVVTRLSGSGLCLSARKSGSFKSAPRSDQDVGKLAFLTQCFECGAGALSTSQTDKHSEHFNKYGDT